RHLQAAGLARRILIVDWDVHHGNGTQDAFYDDPDVFFLSMHQAPHYPGTGGSSETGAGEGEGYTLNVPLPARTSREDYLRAFDDALERASTAMRPDIVLVSAGFDVMAGDPLGDMLLEPEDLYVMTRRLVEIRAPPCDGRVGALLEGGSDPARPGSGAGGPGRAGLRSPERRDSLPAPSSWLPFSMSSDATRAARTEPIARPTPSMLDLIRLSPRRLFPPGGIELYRQIALLTALDEGHEVLDVACGKGVALEYFVREFGVTGSGVDVEPALIEAAEARTREVDLDDRLHFQTGRSDALPYRDEIFDVSIGEVGLASRCDPADAVRELVRVTKPGGFIVLVQLVWKAPVDDERRDVLARYLGAPPRMVVEWKRLLREAGVHELHTEDWSDDRTAFRPALTKPFPDFAEIFS